VGFAPGAANGHAKRWLPEHYAALIGRLVRERGAECVLVGSGDDAASGRAIESSLGSAAEYARGGVANLIGRTDLRTLAGLAVRCRAFVANDSGAMHLVAASGTPVVALFGPTDERATSPLGPHQVLANPVWCRPCLLRECPIDHRCLRGLDPDRVYDAVATLLGEDVSRA
jgi:heptosyltransferase-2